MKKNKPIPYILILLLFLAGCSKTVPAAGKTLSQAEQNLIKICREEFQLSATTQLLPNTLWIYVPTREQIIDTRAAKPHETSEQPVKKFNLNYADTDFKENSFHIELEISPTQRQRDPSYTSVYAEGYQKIQQHIFLAIQRAYFDVGTVPGDRKFTDQGQQASHEALVKAYVKTDKLPDFFVVVIADVTKGLETETLFYIEDMKKYITGYLPADEYPKRFLTELKGSQEIINDIKGQYLTAKDYTWPEFLSRQMTARINFKYQGSSFPPSGETMDEIEKIAAQTVAAYQFTDFDSLSIKDLRTDSSTTIGRKQLEELYKQN